MNKLSHQFSITYHQFMKIMLSLVKAVIS